jgi:hypothetical protein
MVINMLYLGAGSCRQYFERGRVGTILPHLCQALQFFSYSACGCGVGDPIPQYGERTATTPYPTVAPSTFSPTQVPTRTPTTLNPTTLNPTFEPTYGPSYAPSSVPSYAPSLVPSYTPSSIPSYTPSSAPSSRLLQTPVPTTNSFPDSPSSAPSYSPSTLVEKIFHRTPDADGKDGLGSLAGDNRGGHGNGRLLRGA